MDWVLNFTRGGAKDEERMQEEARDLLELGLWGIPETSQARSKLSDGDRVVAYVGAPHMVFVGDAVIAEGWHLWTPEQAEAYREHSTFAGGIRLIESRCWKKPVPREAAWRHTKGAQTNRGAHWLGGVVRLLEGDFDIILVAGLGPRPLQG